MNFNSKDILSLGLLILVIYHMTILAILKYRGIEVDADNNKEIMIFIIGAITSYILTKNDKNS